MKIDCKLTKRCFAITCTLVVFATNLHPSEAAKSANSTPASPSYRDQILDRIDNQERVRNLPLTTRSSQGNLAPQFWTMKYESQRSLLNTESPRSIPDGLESYIKQQLELNRQAGSNYGTRSLLLSLGQLYYHKGLYDQAKKALEEALSLDRPENSGNEKSTTQYFLGLTYLKEKKYEQAETWFKNAIKSTEFQSPWQIQRPVEALADMYTNLSRFGDALAAWNLLLPSNEKSNPEPRRSIKAYRGMATIYERQKNFPKSEFYMLKYVSKANEDPQDMRDHTKQQAIEAELALADFYERNGKLKEAETTDLRVLKIRQVECGSIHPDVAKSEIRLADHYLARKDYEDAEPLLKDAFRIFTVSCGMYDSRVPPILQHLGQIAEHRGNTKEAVQYYEQAISRAGKAEEVDAGKIEEYKASLTSIRTRGDRK